jgi:hypothetical protein
MGLLAKLTGIRGVALEVLAVPQDVNMLDNP